MFFSLVIKLHNLFSYIGFGFEGSTIFIKRHTSSFIIYYFPLSKYLIEIGTLSSGVSSATSYPIPTCGVPTPYLKTSTFPKYSPLTGVETPPPRPA